MKRIVASVAALLGIACGLFAHATSVAAQAPPSPAVPADAKSYTPPKTPWGDPDLQGKWPGSELISVPMQRQAQFGARNWLTDEEFTQREAAAARQLAQDNAEFDLENAANTPGGAVGGPVSPPPHWLERGTPQRLASLVVDPTDGRMPPLTPEAQQRQQAQAAAQKARRAALQGREADTYTDRSLYDRCITRGIAGSFLPVIYNNGNEIVQGPGWVALRNEMIHETRVVPLDGRPRLSSAVTSWMGDSRGHWEGATLVVETTNFNERTSGLGVNGGGNRHTTDLKVTERITRVDANLLVWEMTFDDPKTWTRPWTIQLPLKRDDGYGMFEYACHEGNYALFNILSGARAAEGR